MKDFLSKSIQSAWIWIALMTISELFWAIELSLRPYLLKNLVDQATGLDPSQAFTALLIPASLFMVVFVGRIVFIKIYFVGMINALPPLKRFIGNKLMARIVQHSHSFFHNHFVGNLTYKMRDIMASIPEFIQLFVSEIFGNGLSVLVAIITFTSVGTLFVGLILIWVLLVSLGTYFLTHKVYLRSRDAAEKNSHVVGHISDMLSNIMNIRLFSQSESEQAYLTNTMNYSVRAEQYRDQSISNLATFQEISFFFYQSACMVALIYGYAQQTVSIGDFILILTLNKSVGRALRELLRHLSKYAELTGNIQNGLATIFSPIHILDHPEAQELKVSSGTITFDKVSFHYPETPALFQDRSITVHSGEKVGLVGYSGGGKSTFVNLILRLYEVNSGCIMIDNQDISKVTQKSLRSAIGMIPQEPSLFHRSIIENIRYGKPEASDTDVIAAAKKAFAHDFIMNLPEGYETPVGERGIKLSGGQRQRIAIARAILKNAPILILDEATSQLDSMTENNIQDSLWNLMQQKTTLIIAHRLSTLLNMDRILVFDAGCIVEDGTHEELLSQNGLYKTMWDAQVGGFLPDKNEPAKE